MKRNPFNMERNKSIYSSTHYIPAAILCNQYDPTAIEQKRNFLLMPEKELIIKCWNYIQPELLTLVALVLI